MRTIAAHLAPEPMITVLGVHYLHLRLHDASDLYITEHGRPFTRHLLPENHWADTEWFAVHSTRLDGTSSLYKIATKKISGFSLDIVLKWNRMGQDIPGETRASDLAGAEFNSPFEEFSRVIELRGTRRSALGRIHTQKPLAIYVPRRHVEAERIGRKRNRIRAVLQRHNEITLDANRNYAVIYEWIEGMDAARACSEGIIDRQTMQDLTLRSREEMKQRGFRVRDSKPHHVIVRPTPDRVLERDSSGKVLYGLVDFELLERTPQYEQAVRASKRQRYLVRQAHRFEAKEQFPAGLISVQVMGVDYVYGQVESTAGALWVVGKDPVLFEYFLPEKWRKTPRNRLPGAHKTYHTVTKDNIHLVWQVSRVGERPEVNPSHPQARAILDHGYNSPFEEISLSMALAEKGIETTYPRAIYMTGHKVIASKAPTDDSRYETHGAWTTPEGHPVLSKHHDYVVIWGYWNGPDEQLAVKDEQVYESITAMEARKRGLISQEVYMRLLESTAERLAAAGLEALDLRGDHLLLSLDMTGRLEMDPSSLPIVRLCNFELLKTGPTARQVRR
ncbi:MAG: hypothetical protein GXP25_10275 [Planctomycetes bacterium]|nr:hypothetical protein [Planctomycetota bacterium]